MDKLYKCLGDPVGPGAVPNTTSDNTCQREMLNTISASDIAIVYRAPIDARHKTRLQICGLLVPWSWLFCRSQLFFESTYAQVHENRVEWSNPGMSVQFNPEGGGAADLQCCAACGGKDRVQVIYLDTRRATFAESPTICLPLFTHCDLCPTCCDLCGDGVVMYGNKMILCWVIGFLTCNPTCCRVWSIIYGLTDGPGFIDVVHQQKEKRNKQSPAPVAKEMLKPR